MKTKIFLILILALISTTSCSWAVFSKPLSKGRDVKLNKAEIADFHIHTGMNGPEGIHAFTSDNRILVTDLTGHIYILDGASRDSLSITAKRKISENYALGVAVNEQGEIHAGVCDGDWLEEGGRIVALEDDLTVGESVTGNHMGLNGMDFDADGNLWFASSNMSHKHPEGSLYMVDFSGSGKPAKAVKRITSLGAANGVKLNPKTKALHFTQTFKGVFETNLDTEPQVVFGKTEKFEFFDDICFDKSGRVWATGAGSFVKTWDPKTNHSIRFILDEIGSTSACAIREENGEEIIYITEIKAPGNSVRSTVYDGRGVISLPLAELTKHL